MMNETGNRSTSLRVGKRDDGRTSSLAAAGGCLVIGACGLLVNLHSPGCTALDSLLIVGVFYLLLSVAAIRRGIGRRSGERHSNKPSALVRRPGGSDCESDVVRLAFPVDRIEAARRSLLR